jgi:glycogen operon protein
LAIAQGTPMLVAGDAGGRTQSGNNNAYCQDNPLSWVDWTLDDARRRLLAFTQRIIQLRRQHPIFRRRRFFEGRALQGGDMKDIAWLTPEGTEMTEQEWTNGFARCLGVYLSGDLLGETDSRGVPVTDDDFIVLFNAHDGAIPFTLPKRDGWGWIVLVDTARNDGLVAEGTYQSASVYPLEARSLVLLQKVSPS